MRQVMANRAYLFSPEDEDYLLERGEEYYDSRWNIPILWFLFFDENSLSMLSREDDKGNVFLETFLIENKEVATERFQNTIPKIKSVLDNSGVDVEEIIENLKRWEGEHLVLDPMEIIQGEGENPESETIKDFSKALKYLSSSEVNKYIEIFEKYAGYFDKIDKQDPQEIRNYLIGFTYW